MADHERRIVLGPISFGVALGVTAAIFVFLLGMGATLFDWGLLAVQIFSSVFIGFMPTFVGSITGGVWAFADGFVAGILIALIYNRSVRMRR